MSSIVTWAISEPLNPTRPTYRVIRPVQQLDELTDNARPGHLRQSDTVFFVAPYPGPLLVCSHLVEATKKAGPPLDALAARADIATNGWDVENEAEGPGGSAMPGELGFDKGPFVTMAVFCEKVLQEKDGVLSLIRVIDQLNLHVEGPDAPDEIPPGIAQTTLVVSLRAGEARGSQRLKIRVERPDGTARDSREISVRFTGVGGGGANLILPMEIEVVSAGLYWADILVNDRLVSRVALQINYDFIR